ncbi:MAG TPA: M48 family metalloprotease [Thermodesulfobacteriota bacterium]|nr:M48 family metalloprotease [Thermodesulfobacteriota bacterium]
MREAVLVLLLGLLIASCATRSLPPVTKDFKPEEDEKRLWLRSEEEENALHKSGAIYRDEALETYLDGVARKLQAPEIYAHIPFKIRVLKNHHLNAFAFPNGAIYIHTGLLARLDNEAQLATLLAHEMTHATHRHLVELIRDIKNKTALLATLRATTGGLGSLGAIGTIAAVRGYSRELETEADREGFRLVVNANYDPAETQKLFLHLKKEVEEENIKEPFFFGTHPSLKDRLENYETLLKDHPQRQQGGLRNTEAFLEKTGPVILENARDDLKAGRFKIAEQGIEKYLKIKPESAEAYCLLGDIRRQRGDENDIESARDYYEKAISIDSSYPESYKGLGLIRYKGGEKGPAKKAFELYLSLSPQALDRGYIEEYIRQCQGGGKP